MGNVFCSPLDEFWKWPPSLIIDTNLPEYPFPIFCGAHFCLEWPSFKCDYIFASCSTCSWPVPCGKKFMFSAVLWCHNPCFLVPHYPFPRHPAFLHKPGGLPMYKELLISHAHRWARPSLLTMDILELGVLKLTQLGSSFYSVPILVLSFLILFTSVFLSLLISMEANIVLSLPFTRWSRDFKESPHIKIPFLCNIILIEMLILWRENDW